MNPMLINQAARLSPMLSRLMQRGGGFLTPFGRTSQIDVPEVNAQPVMPGAAPSGPSVPISGPQSHEAALAASQPVPPSVPISGPQSPPTPFPWADPMAGHASPFPTADAMAGHASPPTPPPAPAGVPMPMARPAEAPAAPEDTGFFMRNALMQQDPMGGGFIDPMGASSVTGPDLIQKMMGYLHNKAR